MLDLKPITQREAWSFIEKHHSYLRSPAGCKFAIGAVDDGKLCGVVVVGRPSARKLNDGYTAEVTRCCTDGTQHVASKLYAAAWRASRAMGYKRLVTYILEHEDGISLIAAGYKLLYETRGGGWDRANRPRKDLHLTGKKKLYERAEQATAVKQTLEKKCKYCGRLFTHKNQYRIIPNISEYPGELYWFVCRWGCRRGSKENT